MNTVLNSARHTCLVMTCRVCLCMCVCPQDEEMGQSDDADDKHGDADGGSVHVGGMVEAVTWMQGTGPAGSGAHTAAIAMVAPMPPQVLAPAVVIATHTATAGSAHPALATPPPYTPAHAGAQPAAQTASPAPAARAQLAQGTQRAVVTVAAAASAAADVQSAATPAAGSVAGAGEQATQQSGNLTVPPADDLLEAALRELHKSRLRHRMAMEHTQKAAEAKAKASAAGPSGVPAPPVQPSAAAGQAAAAAAYTQQHDDPMVLSASQQPNVMGQKAQAQSPAGAPAAMSPRAGAASGPSTGTATTDEPQPLAAAVPAAASGELGCVQAGAPEAPQSAAGTSGAPTEPQLPADAQTEPQVAAGAQTEPQQPANAQTEPQQSADAQTAPQPLTADPADLIEELRRVANAGAAKAKRTGLSVRKQVRRSHTRVTQSQGWHRNCSIHYGYICGSHKQRGMHKHE